MASICGVNLRAAFGPPGGTYQHTLGVYKPPWQPSIFAELNLRFPVAQKALFTEFCRVYMQGLYDFGFEDAKAGYHWAKQPPMLVGQEATSAKSQSSAKESGPLGQDR